MKLLWWDVHLFAGILNAGKKFSFYSFPADHFHKNLYAQDKQDEKLTDTKLEHFPII